MYDRAAADRAVDFIRNLRHTKGRWKGVPFNLLPWQEKIIRDIFGTVKPDGFRQYKTAYVEIAKKNGKALALDTPIPTPSGWITMGEIKVGDHVFDEQGKPCRVVATTKIMYGRPCYKVRFSDGAEIVADAEHEWFTLARQTRRPNGKRWRTEDYIHTTEDIRQTLNVTWKSKGGVFRNHSVPVAGPLELPEAELPIPPYLLGVWLGDGHSATASMTCSYSDIEIIEHLKAEGIDVREWKSSNKNSGHFAFGNGDRRQTLRNNSWQAKLRALGLLHNKHIPQSYLRASIEQRISLLQGLMDTDGYVSKAGQCEFTTTNDRLSKDVLELIYSLGFKPTLKIDRAALNGKDCGPKYRIWFFPYCDRLVFRLTRKVGGLKAAPIRATRSLTRQIVAVVPVESVPVRCIEVDSPSHLYLSGRAMIPTHNSELAAGVALFLLLGDAEPGAEIYSAAADRMQAGIVFNLAVSMVKQSPALLRRCKIIDSIKRVVVPSTESFYQVLSSESYTKHGLNVHGVVFDELHAQPTRDLFDVLTDGSGDARTQPLFFLITTAGDDPDRTSIGWEVHQYAKAVLDGTKQDPTFYACIYGLEEGEDWQDEANWYAANPSLGQIITIESVREMYQKALDNPAKERTFRQLRLNQWLRTKTARWVSLEKWDATAGLVVPEDLRGEECYGGLDLSSSVDLTSFCLLFPPQRDLSKWQVLWRYYIPEDNLKERVRRDHVPYDKWLRQGFIKTTPGNVLDQAFIREDIKRQRDLYRILEIGFDPWNATQLSIQLTDDGLKMVEVRQGYKTMSPAMKEIEKLILSQNLVHGGNPVARWNFGNLEVKTDENGNVRPVKDKSTERIDGFVALVNAMARAMLRSNKQSPYNERGLMVL